MHNIGVFQHILSKTLWGLNCFLCSAKSIRLQKPGIILMSVFTVMSTAQRNNQQMQHNE